MIWEMRHVDGVRPLVNIAFAMSKIVSNILFVCGSGVVFIVAGGVVGGDCWGCSLVTPIIFFTNMFLFLVTPLVDLLILWVLLHIMCFVILLISSMSCSWCLFLLRAHLNKTAGRKSAPSAVNVFVFNIALDSSCGENNMLSFFVGLVLLSLLLLWLLLLLLLLL